MALGSQRLLAGAVGLALTSTVMLAVPAAASTQTAFYPTTWAYTDSAAPASTFVAPSGDAPIGARTNTDGSVHTTRSIRVAFGRNRIVYKQTEVPALMTAHTGEWNIKPSGDGAGVDVSSRHSVTIRPEAIVRILGEGADVPAAREFVQRALSTNSTTTMKLAKAHAEALRRK